MAYNFSTGITLGCRDNTAGISDIWVFNTGSAQLALTEANGTVSAITDNSSDGEFVHFPQVKQSANFTENLNASTENGTIFYEQTLSGVVLKMDGATSNELAEMAKCSDLVAVFKNNNGDFFMVGGLRGCEMSAGTAESGTAYGDKQGYSFTLMAREAAPAYEVTDTALLPNA